jgi:hypothetical protein
MPPSLFDKFRHRLYTVVETESDDEDKYQPAKASSGDEDMEGLRLENRRIKSWRRTSSVITGLNWLFFGLSLWMWTMSLIQKRSLNSAELERNYWLKKTSEHCKTSGLKILQITAS